MKRWVEGAALALAFLGILHGASAGRPSAQERMRKHFRAAEILYRQGDFAGALREYKKALEAKRHPAIIFNIGQCHRHLGHWEKAKFFYKLYLSEMPNAPNRAEVEARIREMDRKIAESNQGKISVVTYPPGAEVRLDRFSGRPDGRAPVILTTREGTHLVVLRKEGYAIAQRTVKVTRGEVVALEVKLKRLGARQEPGARLPTAGRPVSRRPGARAVPSPRQPTRARVAVGGFEKKKRAVGRLKEKRPKPFYKRWWFGVGCGLSAALAVGAAVTGSLALKASSDWKETYREEDRDKGQTLARVTDALWIPAAVVGAATLVGSLVVWARNRKERLTRNALVLPACGPGGCGLVVEGRF